MIEFFCLGLYDLMALGCQKLLIVNCVTTISSGYCANICNVLFVANELVITIS